MYADADDLVVVSHRGDGLLGHAFVETRRHVRGLEIPHFHQHVIARPPGAPSAQQWVVAVDGRTARRRLRADGIHRPRARLTRAQVRARRSTPLELSAVPVTVVGYMSG